MRPEPRGGVRPHRSSCRPDMGRAVPSSTPAGRCGPCRYGMERDGRRPQPRTGIRETGHETTTRYRPALGPGGRHSWVGVVHRHGHGGALQLGRSGFGQDVLGTRAPLHLRRLPLVRPAGPVGLGHRREVRHRRRAVQDGVHPAPLDRGDVLDQAAQAQLAHRGPQPGLLVGEVTGGEAQEMPVLGQRLKPFRALPGDGRLLCQIRGDGLVAGHGLRLRWFRVVGQDHAEDR